MYVLGEEEAFDIQIIFTDSESGFFNVNNYSVYNPLIDANVLYNGSGSFVKNKSIGIKFKYGIIRKNNQYKGLFISLSLLVESDYEIKTIN